MQLSVLDLERNQLDKLILRLDGGANAKDFMSFFIRGCMQLLDMERNQFDKLILRLDGNRIRAITKNAFSHIPRNVVRVTMFC